MLRSCNNITHDVGVYNSAANAILSVMQCSVLCSFEGSSKMRHRAMHHVGMCLGTPNILIFFTVKQKECVGLKLESEG